MSAQIDWDGLLKQFPEFHTLKDLLTHLLALRGDSDSVASLLGVPRTTLYLKMKEEGVPFAARGTRICPECKKRYAARQPKVQEPDGIRVIRIRKKEEAK